MLVYSLVVVDDEQYPFPDFHFNARLEAEIGPITPEECAIIYNEQKIVRDPAHEQYSAINLDPEQQQVILRLIAAQREWVKQKVGVDLGEKVTPLEKIYIYDSEQFEALLESTFLNKRDFSSVQGVATLAGEIVVRKQEDSLRSYLFGFHEILHVESESMVRSKMRNKEEILSLSRNGYELHSKTRKFRYLNEAVIEHMRIQFIADYPDREEQQQLQEIFESGYVADVVFFDYVFKVAALTLQKKRGLLPAEFYRTLYQGFFTGSNDGFKLLNEALGRDNMKFLAMFGEDSENTLPPSQFRSIILNGIGVPSGDYEESMRSLIYGGGSYELHNGGRFSLTQQQIDILSRKHKRFK